ncbi:hypothetical protein AQUCO_00500242v1 [Aquilegia coerulea]|uniref:Uncharacterized protein n=1 Tax=Aquilegia coerulea TaxID=218851 RepID=A0A2G5ER08_AQUCA|nr:hypothetical protein AQUCO_00500242v1 [Aquilegia coerulea]
MLINSIDLFRFMTSLNPILFYALLVIRLVLSWSLPWHFYEDFTNFPELCLSKPKILRMSTCYSRPLKRNIFNIDFEHLSIIVGEVIF